MSKMKYAYDLFKESTKNGNDVSKKRGPSKSKSKYKKQKKLTDFQ